MILSQITMDTFKKYRKSLTDSVICQKKGEVRMQKERKTDRRTRYTQNEIKDALLNCLEEKNFEQVTVTEICRKAEVTRATFYVHFQSLTQVLDMVLEDVFCLAKENSIKKSDMLNKLVSMKEQEILQCLLNKDELLPFCNKLVDLPKYKVLFMDETLSGYIVNRIFQDQKKEWIPFLVKVCSITEKQAEKLFLFILNGMYTVNKSMKWTENEEWYDFHQVLIRFIVNGCKNM